MQKELQISYSLTLTYEARKQLQQKNWAKLFLQRKRNICNQRQNQEEKIFVKKEKNILANTNLKKWE